MNLPRPPRPFAADLRGDGIIGTGSEAGRECAVRSVSIRTASRGAFMIVAEQMQHAVDDEMAQMMRQGLALLPRFARHGLEREHNVAEQHGRPGSPLANDSTLVGASLPRQRRLRACTTASSVRTRLISASAMPASSSAARAVSRASRTTSGIRRRQETHETATSIVACFFPQRGGFRSQRRRRWELALAARASFIVGFGARGGAASRRAGGRGDHRRARCARPADGAPRRCRRNAPSRRPRCRRESRARPRGRTAAPGGRSIWVRSPVTAMRASSPSRVRNIFICTGVVFCASSRMTKAWARVRPRMKASGAISISPRGEALHHLVARQHVVERVVERPQIGIDLLLQVAGQEAEPLAGFDRGARQDDALDLAAHQHIDRGGDGEIGLAGAGRAEAEHQIVVAQRADDSRPDAGRAAMMRRFLVRMSSALSHRSPLGRRRGAARHRRSRRRRSWPCCRRR